MFTKEIQFISHHDGKTHNLNVSRYPDGTPLVQHLAGEGPFETLVLRPLDFESFMTALFYVDALTERGNKVSNLVLPFVPGARQDRLNPAGDFLFTAKSVAREINARGFDRVIIQDPHSNVITGLIDRTVVAPLDPLTYWFAEQKYDAIIAPDAGAGARTRELADALKKYSSKGIEVVQAFKHRDVETGKLSGFEVTVEEGKKYLVFDDICDGGGTFIGLGQKILKQDAKADLFVTHGIFSKGTRELNRYFEKVVTTDSTLYEKHDSLVLPTTDWITSWMRSL